MATKKTTKRAQALTSEQTEVMMPKPFIPTRIVAYLQGGDASKLSESDLRIATKLQAFWALRGWRIESTKKLIADSDELVVTLVRTKGV